ncbi:MAG: hypothetical protein QM702_11920 [Rubrivivax sp.]
MTDATAVPPQPFEGLYGFIRAHLLVVNNLIAASCFAVGALDFLAPKLWLLPRVIYSCTAALAAAMLFAALMPRLAAKIQARLFGAAPSHTSLWRRGGWQFAFALLCVVSIVGFASVAKASSGGLAASQFPAVRDLQTELLDIRSGVADIKASVGEANAKLDRIAGSIDPANAADRCADLECAIQNGASAEALRKLFAKGAKVPGDPGNAGSLLVAAATSQSAARLDAVDMLIRNGIDRDMPLLPILQDPAALTKAGALNAKKVFDEASLASEPARRFHKAIGDPSLDLWNSVASCLMRGSGGGMTLIEFAALQGDAELVERLSSHGGRFPTRPLLCRWGTNRRGGEARIEFPGPGVAVRVASR